MIEQDFGNYRPLERIAVGGNAEVFKARDARTGTFVALKVLLPGAGTDNLEAEARLQRRLRHPNLVAVRDYGVAHGRPYLALELVEGPSLATVLATHRLSVSTALHIAIEVLEALAAVHALRDVDGSPLDVVHRDVTPQNIMFEAGGRVKLGDFGIARTRGATRTRTGLVKGKLGYLAPEQVSLSSVDARTDIYQVGLVLFEMLCGKPYFGELSELELLRAAEVPTPKLPSDHGAPVDTDPVVQKALMRFPEQRHASATAFITELKRVALLHGEPDLSFLPTSKRRTVSRSRRTAKMVVGASAIAITTVISLFAIRQREVPTEPASAAPSPIADQQPAELPRALVAPDAPTVVPPARRTRPARREDAPIPTVAEIPRPIDPQTRDLPSNTLVMCLERLRTRGISTVDLPEALQTALRDSDPQEATLCAALDAVRIDRAYVERKLARLQSAVAALPASDPRRPQLNAAARDTLQSLLDGNLSRTDEKLHALERILAVGPQGT